MSTYTDFIAQPNTAKQTLVEIDVGEDSNFINYAPGLWYITYQIDKKAVTYDFGSGCFGYGAFGSAGVADLSNDKTRDKIGSINVDGVVYQKVTSLSDLKSNNQSFYFDTSTSYLYVHFNNFNPPECFNFIKVGVTNGFALQAAYYDDIYYDARIISIPNIVKRKDPLFFGLIRFEGGSIQLNNIDGVFDNFANENIFGQPCRMLFGGAKPYQAAIDLDTSSLIGYWSMNEGTGTDVADTSGYENDGTFEGTATAWTTGIYSNAGSFAGVDERVDCGNGVPLDALGNGSFWLSFWMKSKDTVPLNYGMLFSKSADAGDNLFFLSSYGTANRLNIFFKKGTVGIGNTQFSIATTPFDTIWNHIVLEINRTSDKAIVYMNTVKDATEIDISSVPADGSNAGDVLWGRRLDGLPFEGGLDELRIYTGIPTETEIRNLYNHPSGHRAASGYAYSDFETVFDGTVEDFTLQTGQITLNVQDKRKALSRKIPTNYFTAADYPNIKTRNAGKPVPLGYGVIKNAPVICTNEEGSEPFTFKICDTTNYSIKAIDQVYVDETGVSHGDDSLGNATFSLSAGVYTARQDVTVDFQGYAEAGTMIDNGLDIIADLMALYADTAYNAVHYDTTEWASAQSVVEDMCLFVNKEKALIDIIGDICKSIPGNMIVQDDGLWTFKIRDEDKDADREIKLMEIAAPPSVSYESEEYLSSVLVGYNKDWDNDEYVNEIDTSQEDAIFELYKERRQRTFETLLVGGSAAVAFASTILDQAGEIKPVFIIKTKTQNINLELEDVVDLEIYKFPSGSYGSIRCELIGIEKDLVNYIVTLTLRHIEDVDADIDTAKIVMWPEGATY